MKINQQLTTPDNYRIIRATEADIAEAVLKVDDSKLWTPREAIKSLREHGEALRIWLEILKGGLPSFASEKTYHNIIPSVLRDSLASLFAGNTVTPTFKCNYMAVGTGSTAAANGDTTLEAEAARGLFTNRSSSGNVATLDKFFSAVEVGGLALTEAGIFVDGSGTPDSGYLMSRVIISETMGANETLTINATLTVS